MLTVEVPEPQYLFNLLNRTAPLRFIDIRGKDKFDAGHVNTKDFYVNLPADSDYNSLLDDSILARGSSIIVLVMESGDDDTVSTKVTEVLNSRRSPDGTEETALTGWDNIKNIYRMNYDSFISTYGGCSSMFTITSAETKENRKIYPTEIIPQFLFLGDFTDGSDAVVLKDLKITHVVDATNQQSSKAAAESLSITYMPVNVWDTVESDVSEHFNAVNELIEKAKADDGKVLVHCQAGISRAVSFVMAYLMNSKQANLSEAVVLTVTHRPQACPNDAFRAQLMAYETTLLGQSSMGEEGDVQFMKLIRENSKLWTAWSSVDTVHDRKPIIVGAQDTETMFKDAFLPTPTEGEAPEAVVEAAAEVKPKKTFLKRGTGRPSTAAPPPEKTEKPTDEVKPPVSPEKKCNNTHASIMELKKAYKKEKPAVEDDAGVVILIPTGKMKDCKLPPSSAAGSGVQAIRNLAEEGGGVADVAAPKEIAEAQVSGSAVAAAKALRSQNAENAENSENIPQGQEAMAEVLIL